MSDTESKKQILKSTGILGSAQVIIIVIGMVRVKVLAVLLGAVGIGMAALYQTTLDLLKWATNFGLGYSAVQDIAESVATGDSKRIATTVLVLRRWSWATGLLGMIICIVFSKQLSIQAFGNPDHIIEFILLSVCLPLSSIAGGQGALLQGYRRIGEMARANIYGAIIGLICAVFIYYFYGVRGIVAAILVAHLAVLLFNWWFSRKLKIKAVDLNLRETFTRGKKMATLGLFLSFTAFIGMCSMYIVRAFILKNGGIDAVGYFVAGWSISSMYLSAIFGAMGTDFFPRLSAVQHDHTAVRKLINEQTEIALLVTGPIIIGMVAFIRQVVPMFYSKDFGPTAGILDWQLLGDFFKVIAWPMGFITLAKAKGKLFSIIELSWNAFYCIGVYFGWQYFGLKITGVAFLISYIIYLGIIYSLARKMVDFSWSKTTVKYILFFLPLLIITFLCVQLLRPELQYIPCSITTLAAVIFAWYHLKRIIDLKAIMAKLGFKKR